MKKLINLIVVICLSLPTFAALTPQDKEASVKVYYFHNTRRCATCQAVEDVTQDALKEFYPDKIEAKEIYFESINLEESAEKAEKLGVSGQTLLIVKGDSKENLTNVAFLHARNNPDKLKKRIKKAIDKFVNTDS